MDYKNKEKVKDLMSRIEVIERDLEKINCIGKDAHYSFSLSINGYSKGDITTISVDKDLEKIIKDYLIEKIQAERQECIDKLKEL